MSDQPNLDRTRANMRQENSTNLNTSGKEGVKVQSPSQGNTTKRPTNHIDPGTGKRS
jgi:hypothetical protein